MRWFLCVLLVVGCKDKGSEKAAEPVEKAPVVVTDPAIVKQAQEVMAAPAQPLSDQDKAAAKDPAPILGEWNIRSMQGSIDGKLSAPEPPIMPGSWVFKPGGKWSKTGGNELEGTYVFTGDHLVLSALGLPISYEIKKLTKTELVVLTKIDGTTIENTTNLDKKAK